MIKKIAYTLVILNAITYNLIAQEKHEKAIIQAFSEYFKNISDKKNREAISYIDPDFFEIIPEHELINSVEFLASNEKFEYHISQAKIDEFYALINVEDNYYSIIDYSTKVSLKFYDSELSYKEQEGYIQKIFGNSNPDFNLNYNKITDSFLFTESKKLCAISKDNKSTWKFVLVDKNQKDYLYRVLPEEVIKTL